jgi:hypothetical protein
MSATRNIVPISDAHMPTLFKPDEARQQKAMIEVAIGYAVRMHDWEKLAIAVDEMLDFQGKFVAWWREKVSVRHGMNRHNVESPVRGTLSLAKAEKLTGISNQQVSRWSTRLEDEDGYRHALIAAAHRKAMVQTANSFRHRLAMNITRRPNILKPRVPFSVALIWTPLHARPQTQL